MEKEKIILCMGSSCYSRGNRINLDLIRAWLEERNLQASVEFKGQLCTGLCNHGPVVIINGHVYENVKPAHVINLLKKTLKEKVTG